MTLAQLKLSLALWRRRHRYRQRKLDVAHAKNDQKAIDKWHPLLVKAGQKIRGREKDIAAKTPKPKPKPVKGIRQRTVEHATSFVVTIERPFGSNRGGLVTEWQDRILGAAGYPWCGCFCGCMLLWAGVKGIGSWIAGVAAIEDMARAKRGPFRGWTTNAGAVMPGDLVVLWGRGVHVEMVRYIAGGYVYTVGGNTGATGRQSNGGGVFTNARPIGDVHGFALVNYPG